MLVFLLVSFRKEIFALVFCWMISYGILLLIESFFKYLEYVWASGLGLPIPN